MKIKADFVTNSSSTAYVMHVPQAFKIPIELMQKIAEKLEGDLDDEMNVQEIIEVAYVVLEDLKKGEKIYSEDYDNENSGLRHNIAWTIMREFGLEVDSIELGGGGGMDVIIPVSENEITKAAKQGMEKLAEKIAELKGNSASIGKTP